MTYKSAHNKEKGKWLVSGSFYTILKKGLKFMTIKKSFGVTIKKKTS